MEKLDSLGRATFHHIASHEAVRPTNRELIWLNHIARHGPQSSVYLHALTEATHRCKDTSLRQMQKLRAGGLLFLPRQQRSIERAEFNPYIYDLTPKGKACLQDHGCTLPLRPVSGHWQHQYLTACVTSSIEIAASAAGVRYIPMHEILARNGAELALPVCGQRLIPDQLFALDYGGRYRAFVLEVDRGTEPLTSTADRKSYASAIDLYQQALGGGQMQRHFGIKSNLLVLWVFTSPMRLARFAELVAMRAEGVAASILMQSVGPNPTAARQGALLSNLFADHWYRAARTAVLISS